MERRSQKEAMDNSTIVIIGHNYDQEARIYIYICVAVWTFGPSKEYSNNDIVIIGHNYDQDI
jgi:abortive infection bacteriophage resistance protein